jgi:hypothetical protein
MNSLVRVVRRLRFGPPVIVVSGLPRSGTSLMMQMLAAGGLPVVTDEVRGGDESNPRGYFELEAVKGLERGGDVEWLRRARGRAVKVVSPLLTHLPETFNYRVILMERHLAEVIASQDTMLARRGQPAETVAAGELTRRYEVHMRHVRALLAGRRCFEALVVGYADVLGRPLEEATRITHFVGKPLDRQRMVAVVDDRLYRTRGDRIG